MNHYERKQLRLAIIEAAQRIWTALGNTPQPQSITDFKEIIESAMPIYWVQDPDQQLDWDARYMACERILETEGYNLTSKNQNLFYAGWEAAKDHYQKET